MLNSKVYVLLMPRIFTISLEVWVDEGLTATRVGGFHDALINDKSTGKHETLKHAATGNAQSIHLKNLQFSHQVYQYDSSQTSFDKIIKGYNWYQLYSINS